MLINRYDWFFANDKLIFLILVIAFDRDDSLISDLSEKDKRFSFAIYFRKESHHFFIFYQLFHRQQSIFQHFHCFSQIVKDDRKLNYVFCDFDYFFRESRNFRVHFFFKFRKISVDTNQLEKQKRDQSRCFVSMKRKRKKDDESRKNLSFAEINERKVEALQSIKHYRIREFSNRTFRDEKKNFENHRNSLDYFFHRFDRFFLWLNDFLLFETDFVNCNESDIKIRTIRYSSIEYRTERTSFVFENKKIEHTFNSVLQTVQTKSFIILTFQVICVASRFKMNRVERARLQIFESDLNEIKSFSKFHNFRFVFYVIANVCVLEHVICVVSWFNDARHSEEEEEEKEKE